MAAEAHATRLESLFLLLAGAANSETTRHFHQPADWLTD
jgi:hypothetical protein